MTPATPRARAQGQIVVIFAGAMLLFVLLMAAVIDVSWFWTNNLRMQRAADAAALAGVIFLPGNVDKAVQTAREEAAKNGYTTAAGYTITPTQDGSNLRMLRVNIRGPVQTFFAKVVGINSWTAIRDAKAEYVLPVPMGSPENYYGVFGLMRTPGGGVNDTQTTTGNTSAFSPSGTPPGGNWTNPANAHAPQLTGTVSAATRNTTNNPYQLWGGFNIVLPTIDPPATGTVTINGITVRVRANSSDTSGCEIRAALNWTGTTNVTSSNMTSSQTAALDGTYSYRTLGSSTQLWGRAWSASDLNNGNFRVRLEYRDPGNNCTDGAVTSVDHVEVIVSWTKVATTFVPDANLKGPSNQTLNARGFWGTMLTQGADDVNGDAYLPANEAGGGDSNPDYAPTKYYDYAVEMPAVIGGTVYIFDPVFCATSGNGQYGTGDRYFVGEDDTMPVSSFYELWDTRNTPYNLLDDIRIDVTTDDNLFRRIEASDESLNGPDTGGSIANCAKGATNDQTQGRYWHNRWWPLATGLSGGTTYRVRTATTDRNDLDDQEDANAENSFAIWASSGRIYGIGAMQSFSPLPGDATSEFYLAQIDDVHAGKTVVISLWDPGDTGDLTGSLKIRIPTRLGNGTAVYRDANLSWKSQKGTTNGNASSCNASSGSGTSIATHDDDDDQRFNGCWVTIEIAIPTTYTAPTPPGETEPGWWKIQYVMDGDDDDTAFDVTTWQVAIRGNPVHLVMP